MSDHTHEPAPERPGALWAQPQPSHPHQPPPPATGSYYPPPGYAPYPPPAIAPSRSTNGLAIAALVLGILWIYGVGSVLAIIFGHVAMGQIDSSNGRQSGRGMALAGAILGYVGAAVMVLVLIVAASL